MVEYLRVFHHVGFFRLHLNPREYRMTNHKQTLCELLFGPKSAVPVEPSPSLAEIISVLHRVGLARSRQEHAARTGSLLHAAAETKVDGARTTQ